MKTKLPAYKVTYEDGTSYVTSMAAGITLAEARAYFVGQRFEQPSGSTMKVVAVERAQPFPTLIELAAQAVEEIGEDELERQAAADARCGA